MIKLIIEFKSKEVSNLTFEKEIITIGRISENDICLDNLLVSRRHARIFKEENNYILEDLNSANGTLVNNKKISQYPLRNNDVIMIGKHQIVFSQELEVPEFSNWDFSKMEGTIIANIPSEQKINSQSEDNLLSEKQEKFNTETKIKINENIEENFENKNQINWVLIV
ncbi:MAG: FHA domain-containing protein, partial [bacterium]